MPVYIQIFMLAVIILLSVYAISLCKQLWKLKRNETIEKNKALQHSDNKKREAQESIHILLSCVLQDQVSLTEAAIRVGTAIPLPTAFLHLHSLSSATEIPSSFHAAEGSAV